MDIFEKITPIKNQLTWSYGLSKKFINTNLEKLVELFTIKFSLPKQYLQDFKNLFKKIEKIWIRNFKAYLKQIIDDVDYKNLPKHIKNILNTKQ